MENTEKKVNEVKQDSPEKTILKQKTIKLKNELEQEISRNNELIEQITQEIATVVDEIRHYTDQNEEMEKQIEELITKKQKILDFSNHCKSYKLWNFLVPRDVLILKIIKDMLSNSRIDWSTLFLGYDYIIRKSESSEILNKKEKTVFFVMEFIRPLGTPIFGKGIDHDVNGVVMLKESAKSSDFTNSTDDALAPLDAKSKGFKPRLFVSTGFSPDACDLEFNEELYNLKVKPILERKIGNLNQQERQICRSYFKNHTITDEQRRIIWRNRIGNELKITKDVYLGLLTRLKTEAFSKKTDKIIQGDLDRTFPNCKTFKEGEEMYQKMQTILMLFHIYRPDIKYVQGMTYLVSTLYYYYNEFETFVLFTNLIITKKFLYQMYNFDTEMIKAYHSIFDKLLKKYCKKLFKVIKSYQINTEAFILDWFFTLYTRAFNINVVRGIWDIYFIFGDYYLLQTGISLFRLISDDLIQSSIGEGFNIIRMKTAQLKLSDLVNGIMNLNVSQDKFDRLMIKEITKMREEKEKEQENMMEV